jgi:predicted dehydrogenase
MSSRTRFGFVGLDHWYTAFSMMDAITARDDCEVVGIFDGRGRAEAVAAERGVPLAASAGELIESLDVDVIASFVSPDLNPDIVIRAAEAGKAIVSVKPFAMTLSEGDRVVSAVRAAGVPFVPGESRIRTSELSRQLKSWIDEGRLGEIVSASVALSGGLPQSWPGSDDPGWWANPATSPGGAWIDHALYHLDLFRWLLDDEVAEVSGQVGNLRHTDIRAEDYGHAIMRFAKGAAVTLEHTWTGPANGWRIASSVVGTRGAVSVDSATGQLALLEEGKDGWTVSPAPSDSWLGLDLVLDAVAGRGPVPTVDDAWRNLATALAFYEAAASGAPVAPTVPAVVP